MPEAQNTDFFLLVNLLHILIGTDFTLHLNTSFLSSCQNLSPLRNPASLETYISEDECFKI